MKCLNCEKEFNSERTTARYCSDKCKLAYHRKEVSVSDSVSNPEVSVSKVSVSPVAEIQSEQKKVYKCKHCGKEVPKDVYTCISCCEKIASGELVGGQIGKSWNDYKIIDKKGLHGEDMAFCSTHGEHCEKYCKAVCNGCNHILKDE
jgi:hypothetical protein